MSVTKEITRLEKSNVKLTLTVPKEDVRSQYGDIIRDFAKEVQIPGFRKGKVPTEVLERKFGEALKGEALAKIIEKTVKEVFDDENLPRDERPLPYSQPEIQEEPKLDFDQDLSFSLAYDVFPQVNIARWKGLEVEVSEAKITDDDLNRELEEIRDRNAFVFDREDGAEARNGDIATIHYCELNEAGEALPDTGREDFVFTLGSKQSVYELDDDVIGMKKGEAKDVTKTYPEDPADENSAENSDDLGKHPLSGQTIKLRITLNALKEKKLPDLDDDFAQDVDEKYNTLDDLKDSIRKRLENSLEKRMKEVKIDKLLEKIAEDAPITLPESMIRLELSRQLENLSGQFGVDAEDMLKLISQTGSSIGRIVEKWRPSAEKAIHLRLIVDTLIEEQKLEASDEEIEKELEKIAGESNSPLEDVKRYYSEPDAAGYLKGKMRENKLFYLLFAENKIKAGSEVSFLDIMANNG